MPRMTVKEIQRWRKRLDWSHRIWKKKGYTGEGNNSFFKYIRAYRGEYPDLEGWGGLDLQPVHVIFSSINTLRSQLSARNPKVSVKPDQEDFVSGARIMELILPHFQDELKMKRQYDKALRDALIAPAGFLRHLYVPKIESFDDDGNLIEMFHHSKPDLPSIRR